MKQIRKGDFIEAIFFRPEDIHELVAEGYMCQSLKALKSEQKELLFQKAILLCSAADIGLIRNQTDRNIRKVWNTLLKKLRKYALSGLLSKREQGMPFTMEEKVFLAKNEKATP